MGVGAGGSAVGLIRLGESREDNTGSGWAKGLGPPPAPRCRELQDDQWTASYITCLRVFWISLSNLWMHMFLCVCLFLKPRTDAEGHPKTPHHLVSVGKNLKTS